MSGGNACGRRTHACGNQHNVLSRGKAWEKLTCENVNGRAESKVSYEEGPQVNTVTTRTVAG